jgi:hypothetical protein
VSVERSDLVDAAAVARHLQVSRDWVYSNASLLRPRRLGTGPRARLRFDLGDVDLALQVQALRTPSGACSLPQDRWSQAEDAPEGPANAGFRRRRGPRRPDECLIGVPLLPIRGVAAQPLTLNDGTAPSTTSTSSTMRMDNVVAEPVTPIEISARTTSTAVDAGDILGAEIAKSHEGDPEGASTDVLAERESARFRDDREPSRHIVARGRRR